MQRNNQFAFRNLNTQQGRNFGGQQQQPQYPSYNNGNQQDTEEVAEWLNIMIVTASGERKKLGKGIPLRESNPLERAIIDMLYDEEGNRIEDFDINVLKGAIVLEARPAGRTDDVVTIDLMGSLNATSAPVRSASRNKPKQEETSDNDLIDDDIPAELQQAQPEEKPRRGTRRLGAAK